MIEFDQPTIFKDRLVAGLSSIDNGNMRFDSGDSNDDVISNRQLFLSSLGIDMLQTTLLPLSYEDTTDFRRYFVLDDDTQGEGMTSPSVQASADGVVVAKPGHAVFLPLADCVGAIIYDPVQEVMMVSHLGRHSLEQTGAAGSIEFLAKEFDSNPSDLLVWLSPAAGPENYPLYAFEGSGMIEVASQQLMLAGIDPMNIEISPVDTTTSPSYNSHSQFLAGERSDDGRFAIIAMMSQ